MPRDPDRVAQELIKLDCKMPKGNLNALAFYMMPEETIIASLLGRGKMSEQKNYGYPGEKSYTEHEETLLVLTSWRILARYYKHGRGDSWEKQSEWNILWQRIEELYGWETDQETWIGVSLGYGEGISIRDHYWGYRKSVIDHHRLTQFINEGQRKLQAVKFISGLSSAPSATTLSDDLERLVSLCQQGHLTEAEFQQAKQRILFQN